MKSIAVCDDDESQLRRAVSVLADFSQQHELDLQITAYSDVADMLDAIAGQPPDVVFVDIEFDGKPIGIEAAKRINQTAPRCRVVYLTNYLHYAVDVYKTDFVWFVLKSQFEQRLPELFEKLAFIEEANRAKIVVTAKDGGKIVSIPCATIRYIERRERITHIMTRTQDVQVRDKLPALLEKLPKSTFARCHNSFVVNMPCVAEINASDLLLDDGTRVLVSRSYSKRFRERYLDWAEAWTV